MSNVLKAIYNLLSNKEYLINASKIGNNRINNIGEGLEEFVKDLFCDSLNDDLEVKYKKYSQNFSYLGNKNNPPDIILKNSDAIEVKKIEGLTSSIALNSSYPKSKLYSNDTRITQACRDCELEKWIEKDMLYVIGNSPKGTKILKNLLFIYGECFCAHKDIYERITNNISKGILDIEGIEFIKTNEIAKVKKVDPLGITDLRVRGMWHIDNPLKVFNYIFSFNENKNFSFACILLKEKYDSFSLIDKELIENLQDENFVLRDIKIKSPNNPAILLNAKLIKYER